MRHQIRTHLPQLVAAAFKAGEAAISRAGALLRRGEGE
jgi:hypothetical protein